MSSPDPAGRCRHFRLGLSGLLLLAACNPSGAGSEEARSAPASSLPAPEGPNLGTPLAASAERELDITIMPDGTGLPVGRGDAAQGAQLFADQCEACHGPAGASPVGQIPALTGGVGTLTSTKPVRTVNSFWPSAPLLFDYVQRTMPPTSPGSLSNDDTYSLVAYILSVDGIVPGHATVDQQRLAKVKMPNRDGFFATSHP